MKRWDFHQLSTDPHSPYCQNVPFSPDFPTPNCTFLSSSSRSGIASDSGCDLLTSDQLSDEAREEEVEEVEVEERQSDWEEGQEAQTVEEEQVEEEEERRRRRGCQSQERC